MTCCYSQKLVIFSNLVQFFEFEKLSSCTGKNFLLPMYGPDAYYVRHCQRKMVVDMELQEAKDYVLRLMKDKEKIESDLKTLKEVLDSVCISKVT